MSNQELLYVICLERVNEGGGGSKYNSYFNFLSVVISLKCNYHLNDCFKSYYTIYAKD